jgi:hypothetical protein
MKRIIVALSLVAFLASSSFAGISQDGEKKSCCKKDKKECAKDKKSCEKGDKKSCCKKGKKSCDKKGGMKADSTQAK